MLSRRDDWKSRRAADPMNKDAMTFVRLFVYTFDRSQWALLSSHAVVLINTAGSTRSADQGREAHWLRHRARSEVGQRSDCGV